MIVTALKQVSLWIALSSTGGKTLSGLIAMMADLMRQIS